MIDMASDCAQRTSNIDLWHNCCANHHDFLIYSQGNISGLSRHRSPHGNGTQAMNFSPFSRDRDGPLQYYLLVLHASDARVLLVPEGTGWTLPPFTPAFTDFLRVRHINEYMREQYVYYNENHFWPGPCRGSVCSTNRMYG
jgi:hypothetical protein